MSLSVMAVSSEFKYTFDWTEEATGLLTLTGVTYTVPAELEKFADSPNLAGKTSLIGLRGVVHGALYHVVALGTLSNGEKVPKSLTIRGWFEAA